MPALDEVFRMACGVDEKKFCPEGLEGLELIVFHCCRDLLLNICVWFRVFPLSKVDERPLFAPLADVAFGGLEGDAERGGDVNERPAVEFARKTVEEELEAHCALTVPGGQRCCRSWQFAEHSGGVDQDGAGYGHCAAEVFVEADKAVDERAAVHHPEG